MPDFAPKLKSTYFVPYDFSMHV